MTSAIRIVIGRYVLAAILFAAAESSHGEDGSAKMLIDTTAGKFHVGERWHYQTRPGEESSTLIVLKVETAPHLGNIVHIRVENVHIKNPRAPKGFGTTISHLPFDEAAIAKSVTRLAAKKVLVPKYEDDYAEWRRAFDAGKAGVFTLSVAEAVGVMEQAVNQGTESPAADGGG